MKGDQKIESVLIRDGRRATVCISTQVGCAVNCDFCATAKMGFIQNLSQGEIVDQFMQLEKICDVKITNVVFMGMGEPFLNYKNTIGAAHILHNPKGINLGAWRITISTAGIINKIKKFTEDKEPFNLAVSLNGTSEEQRLKTMPINKTNLLIPTPIYCETLHEHHGKQSEAYCITGCYVFTFGYYVWVHRLGEQCPQCRFICR